MFSHQDLITRIAGAYRRLGFDTALHNPDAGAPLVLRGEEFDPDLTVLQGGRAIRVIAVETHRSLGAASALRWRALERSGISLFIYVPETLWGEAWTLKFENRVGGELRSVESDGLVPVGKESA
ncbi:MAG: hypothetical protein HUU15_05450 [Candidatus Brocadiae bacterium]|nr:hypothetical protein [Candidatus Brocadiia bacterium]